MTCAGNLSQAQDAERRLRIMRKALARTATQTRPHFFSLSFDSLLINVVDVNANKYEFSLGVLNLSVRVFGLSLLIGSLALLSGQLPEAAPLVIKLTDLNYRCRQLT